MSKTAEIKNVDFSQKILSLEQKMASLDSEISALNVKRNKLERQYNEIRSASERQRLDKLIHNLNRDNAMFVFLTPKKRTTELMDTFYHSDKEAIVFEYSVCDNYNDGDYLWGSLVVVKYRRSIYYENSCLTISDLKRERFISRGFVNDKVENYDPMDRFHTLAISLKKIYDQNPKRGDIFLLPTFELLGAQIFENQENYGIKENLDVGTLYGDTTGFIIIGVIFE